MLSLLLTSAVLHSAPVGLTVSAQLGKSTTTVETYLRALEQEFLASELPVKRLVTQCEGARTPALVVPKDELTPLSRRELEVADLAADGLSSEQIAARLFLSVRTVDNHLGHVYQKLGIGSRAELATALGRGRGQGG